MESFTQEEKVKFRFRKYAKEHVADFFLSLIGHVLLTELVVYLCGGTKYLYGFLLSLAYTAGKWLYTLYFYKKEWLEIEVRTGGATKKVE